MKKAQKWNDVEWVDIEFKDLKLGDCFRLFEEDGTPVEGGINYVAVCDAYVEDGEWTIAVL